MTRNTKVALRGLGAVAGLLGAILATGCFGTAEPSNCYQVGDTLGWIVASGPNVDTTRTPLTAKRAFCIVNGEIVLQ